MKVGDLIVKAYEKWAKRQNQPVTINDYLQYIGLDLRFDSTEEFLTWYDRQYRTRPEIVDPNNADFERLRNEIDDRLRGKED